ncbi:hypothetical protein JXO52_01765 [bacterium]|nr:hypothetical protein [bacterium]
MLLFLYFCTGFTIAAAAVSLAHVVAFAWHGVRIRMESGQSGNLKGRALAELAAGWIALGLSVSVLILLLTLYP